jgi:hypothetical protein
MAFRKIEAAHQRLISIQPGAIVIDPGCLQSTAVRAVCQIIIDSA